MSLIRYPVRLFEQRDSLITDLLKERQGAIIYAATFSILFIHSCVVHVLYFLEPEKRQKDGQLVAALFPNFLFAIYCWLILHGITIVMFFLTHLHVKHGFKLKILYKLGIAVCFIALIVLPPFTVFHFGLKYLSAGFLAADQLRLLMKMTEYVSVNVAKGRKVKRDVEMNGSSNNNNNVCESDTEVIVPSIGRFIYFLLAPTLIYRDDKRIDYAKGNRSIFQIGFMFFELYIVILALVRFTSLTTSTFTTIGISAHTIPYVSQEFFFCCLIGLLLFVGIHFCYQHTIRNMRAQILKFGDRHFYGDYWTLVDPADRAANYDVTVSEWLDEYIHKPVITRTRSTGMTTLIVMSVTGWSIEYVSSLTNGFFLPIIITSMSAFFPFIMIRKLLRKKSESSPRVYLFIMTVQTLVLIFFLGLTVFLITTEHYSRMNCTSRHTGVKDFLIPRSASCVILTGVESGTLLHKFLSYFFRVV